MAEISQLISNVQIENVRVIEASMRTSIKSPDEAGTMEATIGRTARVIQLPEGGVFLVGIDFVFGVHPENDHKTKTTANAVVAVSVRFELSYRIPENMSAPEDDLAEFARLNGVFNAWPYFREFVHASLARMGLPPFILPVYRLPRPKKPAGSKSAKGTHAKPSPELATKQ